MELIFSEYTSLYFYSALLQANAAIIALVGLYSIYKLQAAQSTISSIRSYFIAGNPNIVTMGMDFDEMDLEKKEDYVNEHNTVSLENQSFQRWLGNEKILISVKKGIIFPSVLLAIALIIDATMILFSSSLHFSNQIFEKNIAFLILFYEIFVIIVVTWKIVRIANK